MISHPSFVPFSGPLQLALVVPSRQGEEQEDNRRVVLSLPKRGRLFEISFFPMCVFAPIMTRRPRVVVGSSGGDLRIVNRLQREEKRRSEGGD